MSTCTVCLVDDDMVYQFTSKKFLSKIAVVRNILSFPDARKFYDFLNRESITESDIPDILFLDLNMPVMDGWTFLRLFGNLKHKLSKPITIYVVSSSPDNEDRKKAEEISDVHGYVVKPLNQATFRQLIEETLLA